MDELLPILLLILSLVAIVLLVFVLLRQKNAGSIDAVLEKQFRLLLEDLRNEFQRSREETAQQMRDNREEIANALKRFEESLLSNQKNFMDQQRNVSMELFKNQNNLTDKTEKSLKDVRETVEKQLRELQQDNSQKLEKMRETVDEKLHDTLEKRLGESFKLVSERLEKVQKGLGEMQTLATGVGDLKKVLTNVKTRGVLGEYQLATILEQIMTAEQYAQNVKTKSNSNAFVEFAIKLPGRDKGDKAVWLPVDSKFPIESYQILQSAYEDGDKALIEAAQKELVKTVKVFAKDIRDKYLDPPNTTDFGVMFLPIEGLYAEVLRDPSVFEILQRDFKVIITGPTTLSALLNSLQLGFRTLAIEKHSSEVWQVLGAVKSEFGKFGDILAKTRKKLQEAGNVIENAESKSRNIERKLKDVDALPTADAKPKASSLPMFDNPDEA
jgi:DNA recombination protein RmuC